MLQAAYDAIVADHALWLADPLTGARADFTGEDLSFIDMRDDDLTNAIFGTVYLFQAQMARTVLAGVDMSAANFTYVDPGMDAPAGGWPLQDMKFSNLASADLSGVTLAPTAFDNSVMDGAVLDGTTIAANSTALGASLVGASAVAAVAIDVDLSGADLEGADLTNADLTGVIGDATSFKDATLDGADLTGAKLENSNMKGASLAGIVYDSTTRLKNVNLSDTDLAAISLAAANLESANLAGAGLGTSNLAGARLRGAGLAGATIGWDTRLEGADLSLARYNLEDVLKALGYGKILFSSNVGDFAAANSTSEQPIFQAGNDELTVEADTTYFFELFMAVTNGTTTTNKSLSFGGTATLSSIRYRTHAIHAAVNTDATGGSTTHINQAAATVVLPTDTIAWNVEAKGIIRINAAGTLIPKFKFNNAPGGSVVVKGDSYIKLIPAGTKTMASRGSWA